MTCTVTRLSSAKTSAIELGKVTIPPDAEVGYALVGSEIGEPACCCRLTRSMQGLCWIGQVRSQRRRIGQQGASIMSLQGSQKLAILLCKFNDSSTIEPNPSCFYRDLFVKRGTGGLNDYWIAASLGAINLDGSEVFGWKTLDITREEFVAAHVGRWDKIKGAIDQFTEVDTSKFNAVVALFNVDVTDAGAGGGVLAGPAEANVTFLAHETGHLFGLEHSFDHSTRIAEPSWPSAPGEYFDRHDVMSAMRVDRDSTHRFSPRGPLLNVANLDRMGWLPASRVWNPWRNSSDRYDVDIVALEHSDIEGYLAARAGGWIAEFRMPDGFDGGLRRPAVLFHDETANPNSCIIASDPVNNIHEWQPGQVHGNPTFFNRFGGTLATVVSFDLPRRTARLRVQVRATRPPFVGLEEIFGLGIGHLARDGAILVLRDGKIVPLPVPGPELRSIVRGHLLDILREGIGGNIDDI